MTAGRRAVPDRLGLAGVTCWRWIPDWPVSNSVNRNLPLCGPVSLTVIMSQAPVFGSPSAELRHPIGDRTLLEGGLPKVIGIASSAVGPAEAVKRSESPRSERRWHRRRSRARARLAISRAPAASRRRNLEFIIVRSPNRIGGEPFGRAEISGRTPLYRAEVSDSSRRGVVRENGWEQFGRDGRRGSWEGLGDRPPDRGSASRGAPRPRSCWSG